jgi:hypothetical protein
VRTNDNIPWNDCDALIPQLGIGFALDKQMVNNDVAAGMIDIRGQLARSRGTKAPRRRKLRVEEKRAVQPYGLQYL